jgi:hypothetical protein
MTANRIVGPLLQYVNENGPLEGGGLQFYLSGTSTPHPTYNDPDMLVVNPNPVLCDALGFTEYSIFLDPAVWYKVIILDTDGVTPLKTLDPVYDPSSFTAAQFQVYNGNPNGFVAGNQGTPGGSNASVIWDILNRIIWICTTTGDAANAVWTAYGAQLTGAVVFAGVISPASFSVDQNNYNPTDLNIAAQLRLNPGADVMITGIAGGSNGRSLVLTNVSTAFRITFPQNNTNSSAGNRFLTSPFTLLPGESKEFRYDSASGGWRAISRTTDVLRAISALAIDNDVTNPNTTVNITADRMIVRDALGNTKELNAVSVSINTGISGPGGIDTGAVAASTGYFWYVVYNPITNTVSAMGSLSASAPSFVNAAGYSMYTRIGWNITNGSSQLNRVRQRGNRAQYVVVTGSATPNPPIIDTGQTSATWRALTVKGVFVPSTAIMIDLEVRMWSGSGGAVYVAPNDQYGATLANANMAQRVLNSIQQYVMLLEGNDIYMQASGTAASSNAIQCYGWLDNILAS